jgi:hypothetical protein
MSVTDDGRYSHDGGGGHQTEEQGTNVLGHLSSLFQGGGVPDDVAVSPHALRSVCSVGPGHGGAQEGCPARADAGP